MSVDLQPQEDWLTTLELRAQTLGLTREAGKQGLLTRNDYRGAAAEIRCPRIWLHDNGWVTYIDWSRAILVSLPSDRVQDIAWGDYR